MASKRAAVMGGYQSGTRSFGSLHPSGAEHPGVFCEPVHPIDGGEVHVRVDEAPVGLAVHVLDDVGVDPYLAHAGLRVVFLHQVSEVQQHLGLGEHHPGLQGGRGVPACR